MVLPDTTLGVAVAGLTVTVIVATLLSTLLTVWLT